MENWVIKPFLTESDVLILSKENLLEDFARCSKSTVVNGITTYITSSNNKEIVDILKEAYKERLDFLNLLTDEKVQESLDTVVEYDYNSVRPSLSIKELEKIKSDIMGVYDIDNAAPYVTPVDSNIIVNIISTLQALGRSTKDNRYTNLASTLSLNKVLFKDKQNAGIKGTIFKPVFKRTSEYKIILRGIDFLIDQLKAGHKPESWRVF